MTDIKEELSKTEVTELESAKKTVDEFKSNTENRKIAAEIANQIQTELPGWFKVPKLIKVFKTDLAEVTRTLEMLMVFNFCIGKVENKVPMFKIDLDHKTQRSLIVKEIEEHEGKILFLKKKLVELG